MYGERGSSDPIARDMSSRLHSSTFKHPPSSELISSDSYSNFSHHEHYHNYNRNDNQNQNQNQYQQRYEHGGQTESSLMRYRSAPSSFYASVLHEIGCDDFLAPVEISNHTPAERFFSSDQHQQEVFQSDSHEFIQYTSSSISTKIVAKEEGIPKVSLPPESTAMYGGSSNQMPHLPPSNTNGSYNHINHDNLGNSSALGTMKTTSSNLIRQSSSPAGFFSSLNAATGFTGIKDVQKSISSSTSNKHISFSSMPSSSPPFLPQIPVKKKEINDSTFKTLKRTSDDDLKMFPSSITLDSESENGYYSPSLVHHLSLPNTSSKIMVAEKLFRFDQDSTACKIRAKRGCATHPRSIAERVRRTRISERMKKIQALFPTMDKQTSTSDMLDLAVQSIKDLQKELKTLNDARARCICSTQQ